MHTVLILVVAPVLLTLGVFLLAVPRVSISRSRELRRPATVLLGLLALATVGTVVVLEVVMVFLFFLMGTGIEGRRKTPENDAMDAGIQLQFAIYMLVVMGAFVLAGALGALLGAKPKSVVDYDDRRPGDRP